MTDDLRPPLLITGCPRSGTSLTAHAFRACGAWVGTVTGQCENGPIRKNILKPQLRRAGMDELALRSFGDVGAFEAAGLRERVAASIREQGYGGGPWLYKDAKLVFAWRAWARAFPDATWVTVWRPVDAIVDSFERWGLSGKYDFDGARVVAEHHRRARGIPGAASVFPDRLLGGDDSLYRDVAREAGLDWDPAAVAEVVDPDRYIVT